MAARRMFDIQLVNSDQFMALSKDAQLLYFFVGTAADDEGFVNRVYSIVKNLSLDSNVVDELVNAGRLINIENDLFLIPDWKINNKIPRDKHQASIYEKYLSKVTTDDAGRYKLKSVALDELRQFRKDYSSE